MVTGTHIALVRDCFSPSIASVRYQLPAVISFQFLYVPHLLSLTKCLWTYVTRLNLQRMSVHRPQQMPANVITIPKWSARVMPTFSFVTQWQFYFKFYIRSLFVKFIENRI